MAWPNAGNWLGLSGSWLAPIAAALCTAVNERQHFTHITSGVYDGVETEWPYCNKTRPTATDFRGLAKNTEAARDILRELKDAIDDLVNPPIGGSSQNCSFWAPDFAWGGSLDLTKNALYRPNWALIKGALDQLTELRGGPNITSENTSFISNTIVGRSPSAAAVWAERYTNSWNAINVGGRISYDVGDGIGGGANLGYSRAIICTQTIDTYETGVFLGKIVGNPFYNFSIDGPINGLGWRVSTPATYEYLLNGVAGDLNALDFSAVLAGEDCVVTTRIVTEPEFTGIALEPTDGAQDNALTVTNWRFIFDMSEYLTDQT